jgi:galactose mutarotase-like enzyme
MQNKFEELTISSGNTQAKVAPERGGLLTSFSVKNVDLLYLDRETFNTPEKSIRGGIPILFPQAGLYSGPYNLKHHGFAKLKAWNLVKRTDDSVTLRLTSNDSTKHDYPFDFELRLKAKVGEGKLDYIMTVKNTDDKPLSTTYGTHPYFEILDSEKSKVIIDNIENFDSQKIDWSKDYGVKFPNPGKVRILIQENGKAPEKEILVESDPKLFQLIYIWHEVGKSFICVEPWTRNDYALNDPKQCIWINPGETREFPISISAKIG